MRASPPFVRSGFRPFLRIIQSLAYPPTYHTHTLLSCRSYTVRDEAGWVSGCGIPPSFKAIVDGGAELLRIGMIWGKIGGTCFLVHVRITWWERCNRGF